MKVSESVSTDVQQNFQVENTKKNLVWRGCKRVMHWKHLQLLLYTISLPASFSCLSRRHEMLSSLWGMMHAQDDAVNRRGQHEAASEAGFGEKDCERLTVNWTPKSTQHLFCRSLEGDSCLVSREDSGDELKTWKTHKDCHPSSNQEEMGAVKTGSFSFHQKIKSRKIVEKKDQESAGEKREEKSVHETEIIGHNREPGLCFFFIFIIEPSLKWLSSLRWYQWHESQKETWEARVAPSVNTVISDLKMRW